ncbi:MAG: hypothetical protein FJ125_15180 [Deltaproteobacteria bacterium]|nr:hypothetical protein [Deltaproteobacteria bacterium]
MMHRWRRSLLPLVTAFLTLALSATAAAADAEYSAAPSEGAPWYHAFKGSTLMLEDANGVDTSNPYNGVTLTLLPYYKPLDKLTLSGRLDIGKELTNDDVNDYDHETTLSDLFLQASYLALSLEEIGLSFSPQLRWYIPTSESSRLARFWSGVRGGLLARWFMYGIDARWGLYVTKNFRANESAMIESCTEKHGGGPAVVDPRNPAASLSTYGEQDCHVDGLAIDWGWVNMIWVVYYITDQLSLSGLYQMNNDYGYALGAISLDRVDNLYGAGPGDELGATSAGERFKQTWSLELGYQFTEHFALALGYLNLSLPQMRPNAHDYYNPFLFYGKNDFSTMVYLDATFTY